MMEEESVFFGQGNVRLEGLYANTGEALGAVISHPHPLMGGDTGSSIYLIPAL
jgi:alpha/beta superfamily hydrolase